MKRTLWKYFGKQFVYSLGIYLALFLILYVVEWYMPELQGALLKWHDPAFVVGIPGSLVGTAYVLTIRDPKNYTGFYGGILLNILLSVQFALQGNWDLVVLHASVFVPCQIASLINWRRAALGTNHQADSAALRPAWLEPKGLIFTLLFAIVVTLLDYALLTIVVYQDTWTSDIAIKVFSSIMVAGSLLANYLMIHKKIDAWVWWVVYSLAGMIFYLLIGNIFSFVLFFVFLIVNGSVGVIWYKISKS